MVEIVVNFQKGKGQKGEKQNSLFHNDTKGLIPSVFSCYLLPASGLSNPSSSRTFFLRPQRLPIQLLTWLCKYNVNQPRNCFKMLQHAQPLRREKRICNTVFLLLQKRHDLPKKFWLDPKPRAVICLSTFPTKVLTSHKKTCVVPSYELSYILLYSLQKRN